MAESDPTTIDWKPDPLYSSTNRAERAVVDDFELAVFDVPEHGVSPAFISWELYGPPDYGELLEWGEGDTFEEAKARAIGAWGRVQRDYR